MSSRVREIFTDLSLVEKIKRRLPYLFYLAELESSRAGKIGMEVGSLREKIIAALLIYKFGEQNVETAVPITQPEVDMLLYGKPISVKTITGSRFSGVKLIWTVDPYKAQEFRENYSPYCDILLIQIAWGKVGGFHYLPLEVQQDVFNKFGRNAYIKLPKRGTNPRGVEFSKEALLALVKNPGTYSIEINWQRPKIDYNPYKRWVDLWREE
ncbi:MAG TPA: type II restriction endonuclease subunit R [Deltaproteobacteria bacterium]|nr:type II restriction endonuclease subunit R [Deltaproteobacteria bacterium]